MLEAIDQETLDADAVQDFVVVDLDSFNCVQALNLTEQDERVQVVVGQD